ncbi:unnamed protein product, partial [Polarella glacialis]
ATLRKLHGLQGTTPSAGSQPLPRHLADSLEGLNSFLCGVARLLMAPSQEAQAFPLDIGSADLRATATTCLPAQLAAAELAIEELTGPSDLSDTVFSLPEPPLPEVVAEILSGTGRGEALVCELHGRGSLAVSSSLSPPSHRSLMPLSSSPSSPSSSPMDRRSVGPVQRAAFAAAVLCGGPDAWEAAAEDPSAASSAACWRAAEAFVNLRVRPAKQAIAAEHGDVASFEAEVADQIAWLVKHVLWSDHLAASSLPQSARLLGRAVTAPTRAAEAMVRRKLLIDPLPQPSCSPSTSASSGTRGNDAEGMRPRLGSTESMYLDLSKDFSEGSGHALSGAQLQVLALTAAAYSEASEAASDRPLQAAAARTGGQGAGVNSLIAAAASQRHCAVGRRLGLRLLRFLVRRAAESEGLVMMLPALQAALEPTLLQPLLGVAQAGSSWRRSVLAELAGVLRDVHGASGGRRAESSGASEVAEALSLSFLCLPLPRADLEPIFGSLLGGLPVLALGASQGLGQCCARAALLVLRAYLGGQGRGGPALAALLGQVASLLDASVAKLLKAEDSTGTQPLQPPFPLASSITEPLEIDWDFGPFGRLCPRALDISAIQKMLCLEASPEEANLDEHLFSLSLREIRRLRASGVLHAGAASSLLLRLPQVCKAGSKAEDGISVDPLEAAQVFRAGKGEQSQPLPHSGSSGSCVAALTLLRPVADLLLSEVPGIAEKLLRVADQNFGLPACLAICLYFRLPLADEQVASHAPRLLSMLGEAERLAQLQPGQPTLVPQGRGCRRGALAFSSLLSTQLASRSSALAAAVHGSITDFGEAAKAALRLIGGPMCCAACHMQILGTLSGRSMVVGTDVRQVAVLALDGPSDAPAVQWVPWSVLQGPVSNTSRGAIWGENIVGTLQKFVRQQLAGEREIPKSSSWQKRSMPRSDSSANSGLSDECFAQPIKHQQQQQQQWVPSLDLLRALAAVLPSSPCWDMSIVSDVVRELDELAATGVNDLSSGLHIEFIEHRCALLRLALLDAEPQLEPTLEDSGNGKASTCDLDGAASNSVTLPEAAASCVSNLGYDASSVPSVSSSDATLSVPEALSQGAEWRGRYKLKRHTNTWYKAKWHMHMNLAFHPDGGLDVTVRWPKFPQPVSGRNARWNQSDESVRGSLSSNCGVSVVFEAELPAGRREGGRTRDLEVFTWRGHLHFSRGCPHLQGTATCQSSELVYEWYVVPPDPLALFRASSSLDIFGRPEEALLQPFSLMSFNSGFLGQKTEHFRSSLGLVNDDEKLDNAVLQDICGSGVSQSKGCGDKAQWPARGTPHDLAVAAVHGLKRYTHVHGPPEVTTVAKSVATSEESFGLREFTPEASVDASAVDPSSTSSGALGPGVGGAAAGVAGAAPGNARWCPLSDVLPRAAEEECGQAPPEEEPVPREEQHQQQQTERSSLISRPTGVSVTPSSSMSVGAGVWTPWPSRLTRIVEGVRAGRPLLPAPLPPRRPVTPLATVVASAASRSLGRGGTAGRSSIASIVIARRSASALGREDEREDERSGSSPASSPEEAALQKQMHLQSLATALEQEERQLRHAVLMNLLQVMLAHRPPEAPITECFREPAQREAFLRRALRLPDTETMLARFSTDFASSPELAASALTVAVEGLLSPFMAGQLSSVTVETDHQYHPNEDWAFLLQIPGASRMKVKFDCRSRTECGRDFLQFFEERDTSSGVFSKRLHCEEKLSGCYPGVFSDITVPGDKVWMRFQSDGSEQYWGLRFTLTGEGRCASASAVPFPAALRLLLATVAALPDTEQHCARILGASLLLGVSAAQPLSDEATKAVEGLCELLPEPCQWSWQSWRAALNLMGVAERAGRRQLLALLATLLSAQMGPQNALAAPGEHEPSATGVSMPPLLVLDKVRPVCAGVLLNGQATVMASSVNKALAMGPPLPSPPAFGLARAAGGCTTIAAAASAAAVLFCVRLEAGLGLASTSTEGCSFGVGLALVSGSEEAGAHGEDSPVCCDVTALALPGEELAVEVQREAAELLLVVRGRLGSVRQELDRSWASAVAVRPVLWVQGFGAAATLQAPASTASWRDAQQAAGRLLQLQRAQQLVEVCGEGGDELFGCEKTSSGRKGSERSKSPGDVFKASISALKANSDVKKNTPDISEKQGAESVNKSERRILPGLLVAKAWARQERALAHGSTGQGASVDEAAAAAEAKDEQAAVTEELRTQCVALADRSSTDIGVAGFCFSNVRELQDSDSAPSPPESRNLELRLAPQLLQVPGASALELRCKHLELPEGLQLRVTHDRLGELPVMRPLAPGSVGDGGRQHAVEFGKYLFATLDDADPASLEKSAQGGWLQVPQGWELVQSQAEVIPEVIATHCWGTEAMVLGSGDAFYTKGHEQASKAGQCLGKDKLSSREGPDGRMQYQPVRCLAPARILVRRLRPGSVGSASAPGRTEPLLLEDLALGETMLVPGSAVYVHGPGTKAPFWAAVPSAVGSEWEHSGSGGDGEAAAFSGTPQASFASSGMAVSPKRSQQDASYESYGLSLVRPQFRQLRSPQQPDSELTLCSGPWQWALSPHHRVMLVLVPDGSVRLSETTLDAMTPAELEEARQSVRVCGEGVVQPGSGWIDPAKFRLARVSGCWDCGSAGRGEGGAGAVLPKLRIELEGADDLGTASLTFEAVPGQGNPVEVRDSWLVVVSGQVSHLRWGSHAVISGGRLWLPGEVISAWPRPRSSKAAVEVQLMGITDPPAATEVRVLTADEFACDSFSNKRDSNDIPVGCDSPAGHSSTSSKPHDPSRDPSVRRSLLLAEGEYLQRVCGEGNLDGEGSMPLRLEICTNRGRRIAWPPFARNDRPFELAAPDFCEVLGFAPQVLEQHAGALGSAAGSSASGAPASSGLAGESRSAASHSSVSAQSASSAVRGKQDLLFRPLSLGRGPAFSLRRLPLDEAAYWEGFLHLGRTAVTLRCHLTALGASGTAGTGSDHLSRSFSALLIEEASSLGDGVVSTTTRVVGVLTCGEVSSSGAVRATLAGELPGLERCQQLEGRCMVDCSDPTVLASMVLVSGQLGNDSPQQVVPAGQPQQRQSQAPIRLVLRCRALEGPATTPALPAAVPEHRALNVHGRNLVFRGESHHPEKSNGSYISASSQIRDPAEPLGPVISRFLLHSAQAVWSRQLCTGGCSRQQEGDIVRVAEMLVQQLNSSGRAGGSNVVGEESESGSSGLFIGLAPRKLGSADADASAQRILQAEPMLCWPGLGSAVSWLWRSDGSIAHPLVGQQHSPLWRFGAGDRVGFAIEAQQVSFLRNGQRVHSAPRAPSSPGSGSGSGSGSEADPLPTLLVGLQRDAVLQLGGEVQHPQLLLDRLDREGDCLRRRWHHRCGDCLIPCSCRSRRCTSRSVPHASDGSSLWSPGSSATPSCGSGCSCGPGMTCHCHLSSRTVERKGKSSSSSRQEERSSGSFEGGPLEGVAQPGRADLGGWESERGKVGGPGMSRIPEAAANFHKGFTGDDRGGVRRRFRRCVHALVWLTKLVRRTFKGPASWRPCLDYFGSEGGFAERGLTLDGPVLLTSSSHSPSSDAGQLWVETSADGTAGRLARDLQENQDRGIGFVPPGCEITALKEVDGWLEVLRSPAAAAVDGCRSAWFPVEEAGRRRFVRRKELSRWMLSSRSSNPSPVASLPEQRRFGSRAVASEATTLPSGAEPFTVEALVQIPVEEIDRRLCIVAWQDCSEANRGLRVDGGLAVINGVLSSASGDLQSSRKVCDGAWHHVACTFDGVERRLYVDLELVAQDQPKVDPAAEAADGLLRPPLGAKLCAAFHSDKAGVKGAEDGGSKSSAPSTSVASAGAATGPVAPARAEGVGPAQRTAGSSATMRRLRVWKECLVPAAMKAFDVFLQEQVVDSIFRSLDIQTRGYLTVQDLEAAMDLSKALLDKFSDGEGHLSLLSWRELCERLRCAYGDAGLEGFLQACAQNLGKHGRVLQVLADEALGRELLAVLQPVPVHSWRLEAKPSDLSDTMLDCLSNQRFLRFRRQVDASQALLGSKADELIIDLADQAALQQGQDDSWANSLRATSLGAVPDSCVEQVISRCNLRELSRRHKLEQVLSWGVASGKGIEVLEPPFRSELKAPRIEELLQVASGSVEQGASGDGATKQAAELLLPVSSSAPSAVQRCCLRLSEELLQLAGEGRSENAATSAVLEDSIDRMFRATVSGMLYFRFLVILELNWSVKEDLLPFIDLAAPSSSPYGKLLSYLKPRLLGHLKYAQFQQILQRTKYEGSAPGIILNRKAAMTARERGKVDWEFRRSLTGQFMSELRKHSGSPKLFRRPWLSRFVKVQFKGEGGEGRGLAESSLFVTQSRFASCPVIADFFSISPMTAGFCVSGSHVYEADTAFLCTPETIQMHAPPQEHLVDWDTPAGSLPRWGDPVYDFTQPVPPTVPPVSLMFQSDLLAPIPEDQEEVHGRDEAPWPAMIQEELLEMMSSFQGDLKVFLQEILLDTVREVGEHLRHDVRQELLQTRLELQQQAEHEFSILEGCRDGADQRGPDTSGVCWATRSKVAPEGWRPAVMSNASVGYQAAGTYSHPLSPLSNSSVDAQLSKIRCQGEGISNGDAHETNCMEDPSNAPGHPPWEVRDMRQLPEASDIQLLKQRQEQRKDQPEESTQQRVTGCRPKLGGSVSTW